MVSFNIDGLTYTDKLPHSRIERILYAILKKEGSGGDDTADLVIDGPEDLGNGLKLLANAITLDVNETLVDDNKPLTSGAVYNELEKANTILSTI